MGFFYSSESTQAWDLYHRNLENFFSQFQIRYWAPSDIAVLDCMGQKIAIFFPSHLPSEFLQFFEISNVFETKPSTGTCRRFSTNSLPGKHHGLHLHYYPEGRRSWKLYGDTNLQFLLACKPFILYMNQFYAQKAPNEWNLVRKKIPENLGLFGTVFTSLACNVDATLWHHDPHDLEFAILVYFGKWTGGNLILGVNPQIHACVKAQDIVFLKSCSTFHSVSKFEGLRKTIVFYASQIRAMPTEIERQANSFLFQ